MHDIFDADWKWTKDLKLTEAHSKHLNKFTSVAGTLKVVSELRNLDVRRVCTKYNDTLGDGYGVLWEADVVLYADTFPMIPVAVLWKEIVELNPFDAPFKEDVVRVGRYTNQATQFMCRMDRRVIFFDLSDKLYEVKDEEEEEEVDA